MRIGNRKNSAGKQSTAGARWASPCQRVYRFQRQVAHSSWLPADCAFGLQELHPSRCPSSYTLKRKYVMAVPTKPTRQRENCIRHILTSASIDIELLPSAIFENCAALNSSISKRLRRTESTTLFTDNESRQKLRSRAENRHTDARETAEFLGLFIREKPMSRKVNRKRSTSKE